MRDTRATEGPTSEELRAVLQAGLETSLTPSGTIASLTRRPSPYRTTFPLEELTVMLEDGRCLELTFKNASRASLGPEEREAKPPETHDPRREIEVYRSILAGTGLGTARCYAAVADGRTGRYWLCLETAPGVELYQVGDVAVLERVAVWLAGFHSRFSRHPGWRASPAGGHLLSIDATLMQHWIDRARTFAADRRDATATAALTAVDHCWAEVIEVLSSWPRTLLHGEFYASNIVVDDTETPTRVCPVDWEMAADGPGVVDLAALAAGTWPHDEPERIVEAYVEASRARHDAGWTRRAFDRALICARIYLAVQWLGWARAWTPPPEHAHDWAADLARLVGGLRA